MDRIATFQPRFPRKLGENSHQPGNPHWYATPIKRFSEKPFFQFYAALN